MRSLCTLGALFLLFPVIHTLSLDTDVVVISNNDLDPANPNRNGALLLRRPFTCSEAASTCAKLDETLLPRTTGSTQENVTFSLMGLEETLLPPAMGAGLTPEDLTSALVSDRHGAVLSPGSRVWIAENGGCATLVLGNPSYHDDTIDPSAHLPALCTNSAPLTRSNVTSYDTTKQVDVSTPKAGILRGFRDKFTWRFLGIKYAESTAGNGRFQPPKPLEVPPGTIRTALAYGSYCAQAPDPSNGHTMHSDEDCLTLNVYSPIITGGSTADPVSALPVMFYIHGGGLNAGNGGPFPYNMTNGGYIGSSISNIYDGTNLVSYGGVVLVTINYRLNAFGWFNASNAALKDTLLALHWVQDNIGAFGGDPKKVLVFGVSGGGIMTRYLVGANPKYTQGLFSAAILQSEFSTTAPFVSPELSLDMSLRVAKHLDCASNTSTILSDADATCVKDLPAARLALATFELGLFWNIIVDGDYVLNDIKSSIQEGVYARVPTIWSTVECEACYFLPNALPRSAPPPIYVQALQGFFPEDDVAKILNEMLLYPYDTAQEKDGLSGAMWTLAQLLTDWAAFCPSTHLAALASNTTNPGNVYHVIFTTGLRTPWTSNLIMCQGQVCHSDELYWIFGTAETDGLHQPLTDEQIGVMRDVVKRWTEMAWSGSPNYEGADTVWEPYGGGKQAVVGTTGSVRDGHRVAQCDFIVNELGLSYGQGKY